MRIRFTAFFVLLLAGWITASDARAQVSSLETDIVQVFGESIYFSARVESDQPVRAGVIFFQALGDKRTNVGLAEVKETSEKNYQVAYLHQFKNYPLRPFSTVHYHWELTLADGSVVTTPESSYQYVDNRFDWQTLGDDQFRVHWYQGDLQFAQELLDIAHEGKDHIKALLSSPEAEGFLIDIYIYNDAETLQSALQSNSEGWIAGHADPDLGVVVIALPDSPERRLLAEQRIPHELLHILLYNSTPIGYANIPIWLKEGMASFVELYPSADYRIILEDAAAQGHLLSMDQLCDAFPRDSANALLAYAESQSFIEHLYGMYGRTGLEALVQAYANGMGCDRGVQHVFGKNLRQLERSWQGEALSQNLGLKTLQNMLPWLVMLLAVLGVPLGLVLLGIRSPNDSHKSDE